MSTCGEAGILTPDHGRVKVATLTVAVVHHLSRMPAPGDYTSSPGQSRWPWLQYRLRSRSASACRHAKVQPGCKRGAHELEWYACVQARVNAGKHRPPVISARRAAEGGGRLRRPCDAKFVAADSGVLIIVNNTVLASSTTVTLRSNYYVLT